MSFPLLANVSGSRLPGGIPRSRVAEDKGNSGGGGSGIMNVIGHSYSKSKLKANHGQKAEFLS